MHQHSTRLLLQAHRHIIAKQKWYKLPMTEKCHHFNTAKKSSNNPSIYNFTSRFLSCHKIYREEAVCLESSNYTLNSEPRLLNLILLNLIVRWPSECSHYINNLWKGHSVFERLGLWMVEWFHLNGKQANIMKTGNLLQLYDLILRVSVNNYFFPSVNILKML